MLVLSRKTNQTIVIDGKIEIEVLKIKGNSVRLGIKAPASIKILRGELTPLETQLPSSKGVAETTVGVVTEELDQLPSPFAIIHAG